MRLTTPRWSVATSGVSPAIGLVQHALGLAGRVGIQAEDLAQVRLADGHQHQPVDLRPGQGLLVREDLPLAEPREPHAGHEAAAGVGHALVGELLVIDVDGRIGLGEQHALRTATSCRNRLARV